MGTARHIDMTMPSRSFVASRGPFVLLGALVFAAVPIEAQRAAVPPPALSTLQVLDTPARALTLDEVIDLAESRSEQIAIAQFGVARAVAGEQRARSELLPQVSGGASYDRTLKSEFAGLFSGDAGGSGDGGFGADFSELPFGQPNTFRLNLAFSQAIYAGGRISAQRELAGVGRTVADSSVRSARAQLVLDATQAFYDAALADRLVAIAEATLQQAEATLAQVELAYKAGRSPEFEALRARVARDNQRPNVIRAKASRTIAYLRLKQLLEIPAAQPVAVAADLDDSALDAPSRFAPQLAAVTAVPAAQTAAGRIPVQQAVSAVQAREAAFRITRSQRRPYVSINSALGEVAYAGLPGFDDWRTNWTVGASVQIPLFTGGRLKAEEISAGADVGEARARQKLALELAEAETEAALALLDAAVATWQASAGTVEQAARAYDIADLRYREGISTQLELLDARLVLQSAQVNRAQAARDVQVARVRVSLLPDLPLTNAAIDAAGSAGTAVSAAGQAGALRAGAASGIPGGIR
jgi:outer membrane protein TolC